MMLYGKMGIGMMELQNAMVAVQDNTTVKELTKVMGDDSVSNEKKTSFLLQYLLDQREPLSSSLRSDVADRFDRVCDRS